VQANLFSAFVGCGVLLFGGFAVAQSSRTEKAKETVRINCIQGPPLFRAYCASCHGTGGKGDGPMAASLKVKPAGLKKSSLHYFLCSYMLADDNGSETAIPSKDLTEPCPKAATPLLVC